MADYLWKTEDESDLFNISFALDLADGETITDVEDITASSPTEDVGDDVTITVQGWSETEAQARISGGTNGFTYHVTATVTTSLGNTKVACGDLEVRGC